MTEVTQQEAKSEDAIEAWFFSDLSDVQRTGLIYLALGDKISAEAKNYGLQRICLRRILGQISATTRAELSILSDRLETYSRALAEREALIHQLGENAAKAAGEYAEEVARLREALEDTQSTLSAVRGAALAAAGASDLKHIYQPCGEQMARNRAALTEPTDG